MAKTKKTKPLPRCEAYVHVGDKLVNVDDLNAEQKDRLGAALTVTLLNEIYRGKAEFWVEGQ